MGFNRVPRQDNLNTTTQKTNRVALSIVGRISTISQSQKDDMSLALAHTISPEIQLYYNEQKWEEADLDKLVYCFRKRFENAIKEIFSHPEPLARNGLPISIGHKMNHCRLFLKVEESENELIFKGSITVGNRKSLNFEGPIKIFEDAANGKKALPYF